MYKEHPRRTGVYQIRDDIEQLEFLVHIRQVDSLLELPTSDDLLSTHAKSPEADDHAAGRTMTIRLRWQEKILSASECELYKKISNCTTATQKTYHQWLQAVGSARVGRQTQGASVKRLAKESRAKSKHSATKQRKADTSAISIYTYVQDDHFIPSDEQQQDRLMNESLDEGMECMYVYLEGNIQLACLRWHPASSRTLQVYPDFNGHQDDPYFMVDSNSECRRMYAYVLENVSRQREMVDEEIGPEIMLPPQWQLEDELSGKFNMPPKHQRRVNLLFEIHTAIDCEYDRVHVRYQTTLPSGAVLEHGVLVASTHTSSYAQSDGRHYFGHSWQLTLLCDDHDQADEGSSPIHIYFQLISIDGWERERIEGYAYYAARLTPGHVFTRLQCIRPVDGFWDALTRFFIGGRRQFDFVRFFTPPKRVTANCANEDDDEDNDDDADVGRSVNDVWLHNRLGCRMQSTAQLEFSCQCITQHSPTLLQSSNATAQKHNLTLDDIMLAYQIARRKLEALLI